MSLRFTYNFKQGEFHDTLRERDIPIAKAVKAAISETADSIKILGRADIASAGFGSKWQNTWRAQVYPKGSKPSINAAAFFWHKIPYAGVFETGATIAGKPLMWLPLRTTPKKMGSERLTAKLFAQRVGPLQRVNRAGRAPLLVYNARVSKTRKSKQVRRTIGQLKGGTGAKRGIPMFVGVDVINLRKRFHIAQIVESEAAQIPARYFANFQDI